MKKKILKEQQQELYTTKGGVSIYCKDSTLIPIIQKYLKYAKGNKSIVVDGAFGPKSYKALVATGENIHNNQTLDALKEQNSLCNWIANNKTAGFNLVGKILESPAGKAAGITAENVGNKESEKYAGSLQIPPTVIGSKDQPLTQQQQTAWEKENGMGGASAKIKNATVYFKTQNGVVVIANYKDGMWVNTTDIEGKELVKNNIVKEEKNLFYKYQNFYDNKKLDNAEMLFEKLIKAYSRKKEML
jgi:hypothetical protein